MPIRGKRREQTDLMLSTLDVSTVILEYCGKGVKQMEGELEEMWETSETSRTLQWTHAHRR